MMCHCILLITGVAVCAAGETLGHPIKMRIVYSSKWSLYYIDPCCISPQRCCNFMLFPSKVLHPHTCNTPRYASGTVN